MLNLSCGGREKTVHVYVGCIYLPIQSTHVDHNYARML